MVNLKKKLRHSIGLLSKIRHSVPKHLLQTINYSLFNSHLIYLGTKPNQSTLQLILLQEKALKLINCQPQTFFSNNLFKESNIVKISDALFVRNSLRKELWVRINVSHLRKLVIRKNLKTNKIII